MKNTKKSINWKEIRQKYVFEEKSLRELADKYGLLLGTIGRRSSKENWVKLRSVNRTEVEQEVNEKLRNKIIKAREKVFEAGQLMVDKGYVVIKKDWQNPNPRTALEMIKTGFELIRGVLDNQKKGQNVDIRQAIFDIDIPEDEVKEFIEFKEKKEKEELAKPLNNHGH